MEKNKLQGSTEAKGCAFCSTEFAKLVDRPKVAVTSRPRLFRGGKAAAATVGRGRGGRGGRGRPPKDKMSQLAAYFV